MYFKKVYLKETVLWPNFLDFDKCRERGYCFSSEDGWTIKWDKELNMLSVYNGRQFYFPMDSIWWIEA